MTSGPQTERALPEWLTPLVAGVRAKAADRGRAAPPKVAGRRSAVLVLLGDDSAATPAPDLLLLQRAATLRNHAGQPAFPGGGTEDGDVDDAFTALREAREEVGLDPASVQIVAHLPERWIPVSDFVVAPVLGWWHSPHPVFPVDAGEVARVVRVPIAELADPANRYQVRHPTGYISPGFDVRGLLVWGFTALVISAVLDTGGWAVPWDTGRFTDLSSPPRRPV